MSPLRQGFSWWCFADRGVEAEALLSSAATMGYEFVDLAPEKQWPRIFQHGLSLGAVAGHQSICEGLNHRKNAARILDELRGNLEKAVRWNIPVLICFSGNRSSESDADGLMTCAETLAQIAPEAERSGVTLAVELLNSKVDHRGYQADSTAWGVRLCEQVGSHAVKLLYDIYHMQIMEGDLIRTITAHHGQFAHYHTAGNPGRGEPDASQEIFYPAVYRAIAATGTRARVAHEFLPCGNPLVALEKAFRDCAGDVGK